MTFFDAIKFLNPDIALEIRKPNNLQILQVIWETFSGIHDIDGGNIQT